MLKYMLKEALKTYEKNLLYSKEKVQIPTKQDSLIVTPLQIKQTTI